MFSSFWASRSIVNLRHISSKDMSSFIDNNIQFKYLLCSDGRKRKVYSKICKQCHLVFYITKSVYEKSIFCSEACNCNHIKSLTLESFLNGNGNEYIIKNKRIREYVINAQNDECAICHTSSTWNGKPLSFVFDHIDGDWTNNVPTNIRALCPNCHSQTETFCGKNKMNTDTKKIKRKMSNPKRNIKK